MFRGCCYIKEGRRALCKLGRGEGEGRGRGVRNGEGGVCVLRDLRGEGGLHERSYFLSFVFFLLFAAVFFSLFFFFENMRTVRYHESGVHTPVVNSRY